MEIARPTLIVSIFLSAVTLWYVGQWGGKDPRAMALEQAQPVAVVADRDPATAVR